MPLTAALTVCDAVPPAAKAEPRWAGAAFAGLLAGEGMAAPAVVPLVSALVPGVQERGRGPAAAAAPAAHAGRPACAARAPGRRLTAAVGGDVAAGAGAQVVWSHGEIKPAAGLAGRGDTGIMAAGPDSGLKLAWRPGDDGAPGAGELAEADGARAAPAPEDGVHAGKLPEGVAIPAAGHGGHVAAPAAGGPGQGSWPEGAGMQGGGWGTAGAAGTGFVAQPAAEAPAPAPGAAAASPVAPAGPPAVAPGSEPAAPEGVAPPPGAQLAQAVSGLHVRPDGSSRLTIRLDPPELGRVQVQITRGHDGAASVSVAVERLETMRALQNDLTHLHLALDRAGVPEQRGLVLHMATPQEAGGDLARQGPGGGWGGGGDGGGARQEGRRQAGPAAPAFADLRGAASEAAPRRAAGSRSAALDTIA